MLRVISKVAWYATPVVYCVFMAWTVAASAQHEEEHRGITENRERIRSTRELHERDKEMIEQRFNQVEKYMFYLFLASGASPAIVGLDKAGYWLKKRNGRA